MKLGAVTWSKPDTERQEKQTPRFLSYAEPRYKLVCIYICMYMRACVHAHEHVSYACLSQP